MEADADLERVLVIDDRDTPLTLADERIARAIRENNARLVIIDPVQAFLGADVDMNRANEVRPIFRSLGDIAQATGGAIVLSGHLNKAAGTQSTYRGLGSIDITAAVRSLLFIGKLTEADFQWAVDEAQRKKKQDYSKVEFLTICEGLCVQCMHIGAYDDEPATIAAMEQFMKEQGYENDFSENRRHHEIYLSDARRATPGKLKTVIRHPVKKQRQFDVKGG